MTTPTLNPLITDSKKRAEVKAALLNLAREKLNKPDSGFQFEGISFSNPTPEAATLLLILQEICTETQMYSIVNWNGGPALVRTADVDRLSDTYRHVNEKANFIIRGGTDKAADLAGNTATPVTGNESKEG